MTDLSTWFAEIAPIRYESVNGTRTGTAQTDRRAEIVAVSVSGIGELETPSPDPLALSWCVDHSEEISGIGLDQSASLPLLCRGCAGLLRGACDQVAGVPSSDDASHCDRFRPRAGVVVGCCWLWRVKLPCNRLVWFMALPPVSQVTAIAWARKHYGDAPLSVSPIPGASALPALAASQYQNSGVPIYD